MKTDLERFIELYKSFGIELNPHEHKDTKDIIVIKMARLEDKEYSNEDMDFSSKFIGYLWFYSEVHFDKNGKFISQGFWE